MAQLLRRTVGEATRLRTRFAPDCAAASADPAQIESVILNLVINARDAMPQGGEIEVFGENAVVSAGTFEDARELSGNFVTLSVRDEGAGMSPDLIARAFDPFFTTKPVGQGSGLGLSMVYGFAKQSGGHATIRSTPGIGTTVTVYLKQAEVTAQANSVEKVAEHLDITDTVNVLVLEDDDHVATLLGEMLSLLGHQVAIASDPDAARAMLAAGDGYQVIVSDIRLNLAVTGPEFVHEMQGLYPGLKAIFTSASPPEGVRQSSGLDQYASLLQKPFTEDDLLLALNQVMNR